MELLQDFEKTLRANAQICQGCNVPIGFNMSHGPDEKLFLQFSLSNSPKCFNNMKDLMTFVIENKFSQ